MLAADCSFYMTNRIEKIKSSESWKLEETQNTKKDKRDEPSEGEKEKEGQSSFEEKIDIGRLITKAAGKLETLSISAQEIKSIQFKSLSTSREQVTVETRITLKNGAAKEPALIAISRTEGLKLIHCKTDESIPVEFFTKETFLKFSTPFHPQISAEKNEIEKNSFDAEVTIKRPLYENKILDKFKPLINIQTVLYGVISLLLFLFIYLIYRIFI